MKIKAEKRFFEKILEKHESVSITSPFNCYFKGSHILLKDASITTERKKNTLNSQLK